LAVTAHQLPHRLKIAVSQCLDRTSATECRLVAYQHMRSRPRAADSEFRDHLVQAGRVRLASPGIDRRDTAILRCPGLAPRANVPSPAVGRRHALVCAAGQQPSESPAHLLRRQAGCDVASERDSAENCKLSRAGPRSENNGSACEGHPDDNSPDLLTEET
jgi:hypothetical protein